MSTTPAKNQEAPKKELADWPRLVADIGGTNARFALETAPQKIEIGRAHV